MVVVVVVWSVFSFVCTWSKLSFFWRNPVHILLLLCSTLMIILETATFPLVFSFLWSSIPTRHLCRCENPSAGRLPCSWSLKTSHVYLLHSPASPPLSLVQQFGTISTAEILIWMRGYYETCFMNLIYYWVYAQKLHESFPRDRGWGGEVN